MPPRSPDSTGILPTSDDVADVFEEVVAESCAGVLVAWVVVGHRRLPFKIAEKGPTLRDAQP